jgi:hypothetical protein
MEGFCNCGEEIAEMPQETVILTPGTTEIRLPTPEEEQTLINKSIMSPASTEDEIESILRGIRLIDDIEEAVLAVKVRKFSMSS